MSTRKRSVSAVQPQQRYLATALAEWLPYIVTSLSQDLGFKPGQAGQSSLNW